MVVSRTGYLIFLGAIIAERGFELWLSQRNARRMLARGGVEVGRIQYRLIVAFHTIFIAACAIEAIVSHPAPAPALALAAMLGETIAQGLRLWSIATLGENWNTRVIVIRGTPAKIAGPYRYVRHPNYCAVVIEIACVPLIYGMMRTAIIFSILNAVLLAFRIPLEERALGESYRHAFGSLPRFFPSLTR